jgi:hypothetical protein
MYEREKEKREETKKKMKQEQCVTDLEEFARFGLHDAGHGV